VAFFKASALLLFAALAQDETNSKPHRIVTEKAATALTIGDPQCPNSKPPQDDKKSLDGKQALLSQ
jgi:hypothetical protein